MFYCVATAVSLIAICWSSE